MRLMTPGKLKVEAITAEVLSDKCTICGICARVCPYNAITVDKKAGKPGPCQRSGLRGLRHFAPPSARRMPSLCTTSPTGRLIPRSTRCSRKTRPA